MSKLLKILGRSVSISAEWILIAILISVFAIRSEMVQTFLGQKVAHYLSEELNAELSIGAIEFVFFDQIYLKEVSVIDPTGQSLLRLNELKVEMDQFALFQRDLVLNKIHLNEGVVNINRRAEDGQYNYQFLLDYFSSDAPSEENNSVFKIKEVLFSGINFRYDDNRKVSIDEGVDFNHIFLKGFGIALADLRIGNDLFTTKISDIHFIEQSGFHLENFKSELRITGKQISLSALNIKSENSEIHSPLFELNYSSWSSFDSFEKLVAFNSFIDSSLVSMTDIAYFVPSLIGMNDLLRIQGHVVNPIEDMELLGLVLAFGKNSLIQGDFELPDFSEKAAKKYTQHIENAHIDLKDLQAFQFPEGVSALNLAPIEDQKFIAVSNLKLTGDLEVVDISAAFIKTDYGQIKIPSPLRLERDSLELFITPVNTNQSPFLIEEFALGSFLKHDLFGLLKGSFTPYLSISSDGDFALNIKKGGLDRLDINGYHVSGISIDSTSIRNQVLYLALSIKDKSLDMDISATIDLNSPTYKGEAIIHRIDLDAFNYTSDSSVLAAAITFDLDGDTDIDWGGAITCSELSYSRSIDTLVAPYLDVNISSDHGEFTYACESPFFDTEISGDFEWEALFMNFYNDLAVIFPTLKVGDQTNLSEAHSRDDNEVSFSLFSKDTNPLFDFFAPGFYLDSFSSIQGNYNAFSRDLDFTLSSDEIRFGDLKVNSLFGEQKLHNDSIFADYIIDYVSYKDSLKFNLIEFYTDGSEGALSSHLSWEPSTDRFSQVNWNTSIHDKDHVEILLKPSFFSLDSLRWEIVNESDFSITTEDIHVNQFELSRGEQNIKINGCLSENDFDKLHLSLRYVDVSEVSSILGLERSLEGELSGWSVFSNPKDNFHYMGDLSLKDFYVADESIGDVFLRTGWDNVKNAINMRGELNVDSFKTLNIKGYYFTKNENLDLELNFDNTDVSFLNALMDPDVINSIAGNLDGQVKVDGPWSKPELSGGVALDSVSAKVELLGVSYFVNSGTVAIEEKKFVLDHIPLCDSDGNTGSILGKVLHDNFQDWSYDIKLNLEDDITKWRTNFPFGFEPLDKFLLLDTKYKDGDSYFGKAYGRGNANISGSGGNMMIALNVDIEDNTEINFPLYGSSEIDEDFEYVHFKSDKNLESNVVDKFDFSGLDLDLNFNLTPQAKLNIILDPTSGDEILARGSGAINMKLNPFYEVDLNGTYTISEGSTYNFAMGLIKQNFTIEKGSTISWTGDPYNADIDLVTSFALQKVSLKDLAPELVLSDQESNQMKNQKVLCYLNLNETLLAPQISFDIDVPNAPETGKALINEVVSEETELSKQFFSLLLLRSFQPLNSSIEAHASAAKDLAESQINALLGDVSEEYDMSFSSVVGKDLVGLDLIEFGISRRFFNDRLILSGSFGLEEDSTGESNEASYIPVGDLFVEYLINESGTFRARAFREADTYNAGNNESGQKAYNHGAGISYQEDFTNVKDFKLLQYIFDIFRPKDKRRFLLKKKRRLTKIDS